MFLALLLFWMVMIMENFMLWPVDHFSEILYGVRFYLQYFLDIYFACQFNVVWNYTDLQMSLPL